MLTYSNMWRLKVMAESCSYTCMMGGWIIRTLAEARSSTRLQTALRAVCCSSGSGCDSKRMTGGISSTIGILLRHFMLPLKLWMHEHAAAHTCEQHSHPLQHPLCVASLLDFDTAVQATWSCLHRSVFCSHPDWLLCGSDQSQLSSAVVSTSIAKLAQVTATDQHQPVSQQQNNLIDTWKHVEGHF